MLPLPSTTSPKAITINAAPENVLSIPASGGSVPAIKGAQALTPWSAGRYDGAATNNRVLEGWNVGLDAPEPPGAEYERGTLVSRLRDLERNDPLARSTIEKRIDSVIGSGWSLTSKPNHKALGIEFDAAVDFAEQVECLWEMYITDPQGKFTEEETYTFSEIIGLAYRCGYRDGEAFALVTYDDDNGRLDTGTRLQLVDADRVSNPQNAADTETRRRGIELTNTGRPVGFHIREGHPADWTTRGKNNSWREVPMRTETGRPNILHFKQITRPGQLRGVSRLAPVIKALRSTNVFDDAELQSKVANALVSTIITSNYDVSTVSNNITAEEVLSVEKDRMQYYKDNPSARKNPLGGRSEVLPYGDTKEAIDTKRETGEDFIDRVLHNIAAGAGISFEQLTMNWSKVNYSSARAALLEVHKNMARDQEHFSNSFMMGWFYAWMEEQFARGNLVAPKGAPDFWDMPTAYCAVEWIYPALGWVDPVKEVQAAGMRMNLQLSTQEAECAVQGKNWKKVLMQLARERRTREELGLPIMDYSQAMSTNAREDKSEARETDDNEHMREQENA